MPREVERAWLGDPGTMGGRRARAPFRYRAFVPDPIAGIEPVVPFETADLAADAEAAIRALNERASVAGLEVVGPLLLRSEAVASSRIEGYDVSPPNLARAHCVAPVAGWWVTRWRIPVESGRLPALASMRGPLVRRDEWQGRRAAWVRAASQSW